MDWKNGCVAVLKEENEPIGTGFVVHTTGIIVTCAHPLRPQPDGTILLRFTVNNQIAQAIVIEEWGRGRDEEDIAFLRLTTPLPSDVPVLPLSSSRLFMGRAFHCWGYPVVKGYAGMGADGRIVAQTKYNTHQVRP